MEHLHHFGLSEDPFRNEPLMRFFLETRQQGGVLKRLERGVRQAKALSVLIGDAGSGKTMAVRQLLEGLEEEVFEAGMLVVLHGAADATWMLTRLARQLGVEEPSAEREGLLAQIYECLAIVREDGRHTVFIIDDAQALCSPGTLAEVCGLLKLEYEDRRLMSLVLAGTPPLARALADAGLAQRADVRVVLEPLGPEETASYLSHRIRTAGGHPAIIDEAAIGALHELAKGIPGKINTLADNALFEAFLCGRDRVTRTDVERAHTDLGWDERPVGVSHVPVAAPRAGVPAAVPVEQSPAPAASQAAPPAKRAPAPSAAETTAPSAPAPADDLDAAAALDDALDDLDSELEAVFEPGPGDSFAPGGAPPKEDADVDDLMVELLD